MTCPAAEGRPEPGGHRETKAHLGSQHGSMAPQGSEGHQETKAHLGSAVTRGSLASWTSAVSQDHRETKAHLGSVTYLGFVANQNVVISQGFEEHLGTRLSQVSVTHLASVATQDHLEMEVHQELVASRGSGDNQEHPELDTNVPLDSKVNQGSGPVANQKTKVNQSPTAPPEAKVNQDPVVCLDLRVHQAPKEPRAPLAHPDSPAGQALVALTDWNVHHAPVAEHSPADPRDTNAKPGPPDLRPPARVPKSPSGARLGLVLLTLGSLLLPCARGSALEFGGAPGQWARTGGGRRAPGGQLSFRFKTNVTRGLLLYLDDGGNCDFLELLVAEGRLRLRFAIACAEPATLEPPAPVSDGRWHAVLLTRQARHAALAVDGEARRAAAVRSKRPDMAVASDLFVGGIPPDVRLSALTLSTVKYEPPFPRVGGRPAAWATRRPLLLGAQGVRGDGDERCAHHPPCAHGGPLHPAPWGAPLRLRRHRATAGPSARKRKNPRWKVPPTCESPAKGPPRSPRGGPAAGAGEIQQAAKGRAEYVPRSGAASSSATTCRGRRCRAARTSWRWRSAGAVWLVINLGAGAFEALVEPVNGKFHDGGWHHVRVTRNLRQVGRRPSPTPTPPPSCHAPPPLCVRVPLTRFPPPPPRGAPPH
ncbi:LOW QUALITY PROTEIN: neurexin-1-like [Ammospiza maritima maritima]